MYEDRDVSYTSIVIKLALKYTVEAIVWKVFGELVLSRTI